MPTFDSDSTIRHRSLLWIAALAVLCLGSFALVAGAGIPIPAADGEGPWMNPVSLSECSQEQAGTVCAEWPVRSVGMAVVCCVDADVVGTFQKNDECKKSLGIRAF